jgi:D-alanyl-D-alanine carboxypeptidase
MNSPERDLTLTAIHRELQIPNDYARTTGLPFYREVALDNLVVVQLDNAGRPLILTKKAGEAWGAMCAAAVAEGIQLLPFSGFRSYVYQKGLILAKLNKGFSIGEILRSLAAPGYSEHHTGEAVDITTVDCPAGEEIFEVTPAHGWLARNAERFGFKESFHRSNPHNLVYEPWHWKFHGL